MEHAAVSAESREDWRAILAMRAPLEMLDFYASLLSSGRCSIKDDILENRLCVYFANHAEQFAMQNYKVAEE